MFFFSFHIYTSRLFIDNFPTYFVSDSLSAAADDVDGGGNGGGGGGI